MKMLFLCPIWGMAGQPLRAALSKIKAAGYDGVEFGCEAGDPVREEFMMLAKELELVMVAQQYAASGADVDAYAVSYEANLRYQVSFNPLFVNSHTGRDFYKVADNIRLLEIAARVEQETGCRIVHETHRGRFPFCAAVTRQYIDLVPDLQFTGDFSHFCTVSESFLEDQQDTIDGIIPHVHHLHARVGHPQGPQVTDPRLPEWQHALAVHLRWWDAVVDLHRKAGTPVFTITPEFGPVPYMPSVPFTQQPVASQWEINLYMARLLRERYKAK